MKTKKLRNKLPQPVEKPSGEKQDSLPRRSRLCLVLHKRAGMRKKMQLGAYLSTSIGCWRSKEQIKWHKITSYKTKKKKKRSGAEAATAGKRLRHCTGWRMLDPKILLRQEEELQAGTRQAESWSEVHK